MTDRELTPAERAQLAETKAVIEADIRISLAGKPMTRANLTQAAIEAAASLAPPPADHNEIILERDALDGNRINILAPVDWFTRRRR